MSFISVNIHTRSWKIQSVGDSPTPMAPQESTNLEPLTQNQQKESSCATYLPFLPQDIFVSVW